MKIKDIEKIVRQNIEAREKELGRKLMKKERTVAILIEELKITEFDPAFYFGTKSQEEIHNETVSHFKNKPDGGKVTIDDIGEIEVKPELTCKMLSVIYKFIADRYGLVCELEGQNPELREEIPYSDYWQMQNTSIFEHVYNIVTDSYGEYRVDVQDESQVLKIKSKPRFLAYRMDFLDRYRNIDGEELDRILNVVGYKKEGEPYTDEYVSELLNKIKQSKSTDIEKFRDFINDEYLQSVMKNAGVVASHKFYSTNLKSLFRTKGEVKPTPFSIIPCRMEREKEGKKQTQHSYIVYFDDNQNKEIYMYSNSTGLLSQVAPELLKKLVDAGMEIGQGRYVNADQYTKAAAEKVLEYISTKKPGNGTNPPPSIPGENGGGETRNTCTDSMEL